MPCKCFLFLALLALGVQLDNLRYHSIILKWLLLIAMNRQKFIMNNRLQVVVSFVRSWYTIIGMNYHIEQVPLCCRVCGLRLWKFKAKQKISYEYNAFTADLKIDKHLWELMSTHIRPGLLQCTLFEQYNNMTSWCEHFSACVWTHEMETYDSMMIRGGGGGGGKYLLI